MSKGKSYIKYKATGKIIVQAKTREEALEKAKEMFQEKLEEEHESFIATGLSSRLSDDLMLFGLEEPKKTTKRKTEIDVRWTNIKGRAMTKGGKII